jgi:hypothetical protein
MFGPGGVRMAKLIGKVTLKNAYRVLEDAEGDYKVTHKDARGAEYSQDVAADVVNYLYKHLRGETVAVADAMRVLEDAAEELDLPYQYGFKLQFYTQNVLVVLVALRQASYKKAGQRFEYTLLVQQAKGKQAPNKRAVS